MPCVLFPATHWGEETTRVSHVFMTLCASPLLLLLVLKSSQRLVLLFESISLLPFFLVLIKKSRRNGHCVLWFHGFFFSSFFYFLLCEWLFWKSLGKRVIGSPAERTTNFLECCGRDCTSLIWNRNVALCAEFSQTERHLVWKYFEMATPWVPDWKWPLLPNFLYWIVWVFNPNQFFGVKR